MNKTGTLYVVATPIGNIQDISNRAIEVLTNVDVILAEDTRHSQILLNKLGIQKRMSAFHEHNEEKQTEKLCQKLLEGITFALISDAGTPLISDPGFRLVRQAQALKIPIVPIPGPSAVITALSVSGMPTDRFIFEGFLPAKSGARKNRLEALREEVRTIVFYEAPHRLLHTLADMQEVLGSKREVVLARELTKTFETIRRQTLGELKEVLSKDTASIKGEIVLVVAGADSSERASELTEEAKSLLKVLLSQLSTKQASELVSKYTGISKRLVYEAALTFKTDSNKF